MLDWHPLVITMAISRRKFLKKGVQGASLVSGLGLSGLSAAFAGNEEKVDANTGLPENESEKPKKQEEPIKKTSAEEPVANQEQELPAPKLPTIKGQIVSTSDPEFNDARKNYNGRFDIKPKYIFYCENENDISETIRWAREQKLKVAIRSGGHSYEAFSLVQDGVVIDVSKMNNVQIDSAKKIARVGAGTTLIPLYDALWQKRVVVPAGSCETVGIAGVALGGGFGLLARSMGLSCDNIQTIRMIDAEGKTVVADAKTNSDLLWACKGGGAGNFGVITQLTFKVHPINNVTIIRLRWNWQDMKAIIEAWQNWAPNTDSRLTSVLTMSSKGANSLMLLGMFLGPPAQASALIQPMVQAAKPVKEAIELSSFIDAAHRFSGFKRPKFPPAAHEAANHEALPETVHMHAHPRFKNTSDYINSNLSSEAIDTIIKFLTECPIRSSCVQFDSYGGAITKVPADATAFCHRAGTKFCMHYQCSWGHASDDSTGITWINSFRQAMQAYASGFSYANYCDSTIEDFAHRYFGDNVARLSEVKRKYDPEGFFSFPQSIPVSSV
jgi:FAD/FMN-containing dehydrogenase